MLDFIYRNLSVIAKASLDEPVQGITQGLFVSAGMADYFRRTLNIESDPVKKMEGVSRDFSHFAYQLRLEGEGGLIDRIGKEGVQDLLAAAETEVPIKSERPQYFADRHVRRSIPVITGGISQRR